MSKTHKQRVRELEAEVAELRLRLDPAEVERQAALIDQMHQKMIDRSKGYRDEMDRRLKDLQERRFNRNGPRPGDLARTLVAALEPDEVHDQRTLVNVVEKRPIEDREPG